MLSSKTIALIPLFSLFFCITESKAQQADTTEIKKPKMETPNLSFTMPALNPEGVSLHNISKLFEPQMKGYRFYQDLVWPAPRKELDPTKMNFDISFNTWDMLNAKNNLSLDPSHLYLSFNSEQVSHAYLIFAFLLSRFNNRIVGVDKESRMQIKEGVYSRPGVPASVKDPFEGMYDPSSTENTSMKMNFKSKNAGKLEFSIYGGEKK